MITKPNYLPPALLLFSLLNGCATTKPVPQPIAVPCQKPVITKTLLQPAQSPQRRQEFMNALPTTTNPAKPTPPN